MSRGSALALLLAFAAALGLRIFQLGARPFHHDESINAVKVTALWQEGRYAYDPDEYHGPTLHYATLPFLWLSGAHTPENLHDATLRLAPVVFGVGLILLTLLFADGLGSRASAWAAVFTAVSPAMVFYSRYFIHEMLLVFFTALTLGAGWRYVRTRAARWAGLAGAGLGLMFATKETFVLPVAAMVAAAFVMAWQTSPEHAPVRRLREFWNPRHAALAAGTALMVWLVFFSSFFTNMAGLKDSVITYFPWLKRAAGHSPHIHPWYFYLHRLAWFHAGKGPIWSEGLILVLAAVGAVSAFLGERRPLVRFLVFYTLALTAIYCVISYKTPWCLLGFFHGMILLAGVGAATAMEWLRGHVLRFAILALLAVGALHLAWQAWLLSWPLERAGVVYCADRRNPYVYAQTPLDYTNLVAKIEGLARTSAKGYDTVIKTIVPGGEHWPLPWSLRRFRNVEWLEQMPADPYAPIIIVSSQLDARLDEKSGKKWLMASLTELRPGRFLELYVELELWKKYVTTLPPSRD